MRRLRPRTAVAGMMIPNPAQQLITHQTLDGGGAPACRLPKMACRAQRITQPNSAAQIVSLLWARRQLLQQRTAVCQDRYDSCQGGIGRLPGLLVSSCPRLPRWSKRNDCHPGWTAQAGEIAVRLMTPLPCPAA